MLSMVWSLHLWPPHQTLSRLRRILGQLSFPKSSKLCSSKSSTRVRHSSTTATHKVVVSDQSLPPPPAPPSHLQRLRTRWSNHKQCDLLRRNSSGWTSKSDNRMQRKLQHHKRKFRVPNICLPMNLSIRHHQARQLSLLSFSNRNRKCWSKSISKRKERLP